MEKNLVAMQAFTSYFDTGILRYEEQTEELIKTLDRLHLIGQVFT